jgi:acyl carrier protein
MGIENFIRKIEGEFDELQPGLLKPESRFREVFEWNSINALILVAMVKTEYDVALSPADLIVTKSVQDIYNIIEIRIKTK